MTEKTLSFITVNLNNLDGLHRTYRSLRKQKEPSVEWIVVDGGSTDGAKEALERKELPADKWVSERDRGIYSGMAKGIEMATGLFVIFLNSGDCLLPNAIFNILDNIRTSSASCHLYGFRINGTLRYPRPLWWRFWSLPTSHQAIVYEKSMLLQFEFDSSYSRGGDFEQFLRISSSDHSIRSHDLAIVENEPYGSDLVLDQVIREYREILNRYMPRAIAVLLTGLKRVYLRWALKK